MDNSILIIHEPVLSGTTLTCRYTFGSEQFTNSYHFSVAISRPTSALTEKLCQWVAIATAFGLFSVEYFDELACEFGLTDEEVAFFEKIIFMGLGEFRYVNRIPLNKRTVVHGTGVPITITGASPKGAKGALLLNGGGKDGSVSAHLLQMAGISFTWFQRGRSAAQQHVVQAWNAPVFTVMRSLDPHRNNRKYSGHRPMSAGIALLAVLSAHLFDYSEVIASNEASANEGNLMRDGFTVNHQYSKSLEFEQDLQTLLAAFHVSVDYFSLLRPLYELQIAQLATELTPEQLGAITSCNNGTKEGVWCLNCAKCAFVILAITASSLQAAKGIWGDAGIINLPSLRPYLTELLDPNTEKPLECVGMLPECQLAAHLIVSKHNDILDESTRELLAHYAELRDKSQDRAILSHRGPYAAPERFRAVLPPAAI